MAGFFSIVSIVLAIDIVTKVVVRAKMPFGAEIAVLPFFSITHVSNTGIAFGMFQGWNPFFIAIGIVVTAVLIGYGIQMLRTDRASAFAMAAIVGGAIGNLVDRVVSGRVTDFLDFYLGAHHWPVFNVADSTICVGAAFVAIRGLWMSRRRA